MNIYKLNIATEENIPMNFLESLKKALENDFEIDHFEIYDGKFDGNMFNLKLTRKIDENKLRNV
jgi:uncharacterized protein (DUF2344 family)